MSEQKTMEETANQAWATVLDHIRQSAPALAVTLERSRLVPAPSHEWRLIFKDAFSMENAQRRQGPIETKLSEAVGRQIHLSFELGVKKDVAVGATTPGETKSIVPEWMVPVGVVYEATKSKWNLQRRAVQWYATQGLIPKPEHIGREAYYDKRTIYDYFEIIQALSRRWDLSLNEIRRVIAHAEKLEAVETPSGMSAALPALLAFLGDYSEYEQHVHELYGHEDERTGEMSLGGDAWNRIRGVQEAIKNALRGTQDNLQAMLSKRVLDMEEELGKKNDSGLEEIPF